MARIRSVKPEFWTDSRIVQLPMDVRLFYIGMWNFADDFGVLEDDPVGLQLQILPADDVDVTAYLDVLISSGRVRRAVAPDGTRVLVVVHFTEHQRISHKAEPRFGDPEDFVYDDITPEVSGVLANPPEPSARKGRDRKGTREYDGDFEAWWSEYPRKVDKAEARAKYTARRRDGVPAETLLCSLRNYAKSVADSEPRFVKHAATFLNGKDGPWSECIDAAPETRPNLDLRELG